MKNNYRLVTKSNIDGIVSAILLKHLEIVSDVIFVREEDMKKGSIPLSAKDILVNLPYARGVHQAFDYHDSSTIDELTINENHIFDTTLHSASELIFSHYHDRFQTDSYLEKLVQMATNETHHVLTTSNRMYVYTEYEKVFETTLVEA